MEVRSMSEYNIDIADMQCWVFRMAQSKWKMCQTIQEIRHSWIYR